MYFKLDLISTSKYYTENFDFSDSLVTKNLESTGIVSRHFRKFNTAMAFIAAYYFLNWLYCFLMKQLLNSFVFLSHIRLHVKMRLIMKTSN